MKFCNCLSVDRWGNSRTVDLVTLTFSEEGLLGREVVSRAKLSSSSLTHSWSDKNTTSCEIVEGDTERKRERWNCFMPRPRMGPKTHRATFTIAWRRNPALRRSSGLPNWSHSFGLATLVLTGSLRRLRCFPREYVHDLQSHGTLLRIKFLLVTFSLCEGG